MKVYYFILLVQLVFVFQQSIGQIKPYTLENDLNTVKENEHYKRIEYAKDSRRATSGNIDKRDQHYFENFWLINDTSIDFIEAVILSDSSYEIKSACIRSLVRLESVGSIPILIKASEANDYNLKLSIGRALVLLGDTTHSFKLFNECFNNQFKLNDSVIGFTINGSQQSKEKLIEILNHENKEVVAGAAKGLAMLHESDIAWPYLIECLQNENRYIKSAALGALPYIADQKSIDILKSMVNDSDTYISRQATLCLKNINAQ